ncbi:hypothetical protein G7K_4312-t1 [Saitoella complicata NRRL Y-17804]|uniref:Uncharacterized protein n=1 Tax=Saitoella complicata (strain BCRC 22490 / CBS 7301 / JCM 7358 / NBRC 10748 / NRRL Y-17804) TaxID=698492 RepID=A0A0E9NK44_SAICN|nr:hypothetical protein G7K_4312-t1 [Saitoella complicata NRRL Y-17804]
MIPSGCEGWTGRYQGLRTWAFKVLKAEHTCIPMYFEKVKKKGPTRPQKIILTTSTSMSPKQVVLATEVGYPLFRFEEGGVKRTRDGGNSMTLKKTRHD